MAKRGVPLPSHLWFGMLRVVVCRAMVVQQEALLLGICYSLASALITHSRAVYRHVSRRFLNMELTTGPLRSFSLLPSLRMAFPQQQHKAGWVAGNIRVKSKLQRQNTATA